MLGELITRSLVLILGYAYPALECFKTVEKNRVEIEELRFWCQYWIIVAILTILERLGDTFISWIPMYGEIKLAVFIYLWYPKTKGTGYIYETLLQPYMLKHETDVERTLLDLRSRAWDLAIYYWQNCSELGQTKFFEIFEYLASKPKTSSDRQRLNNHDSMGISPPLPNTPLSFFHGTDGPTPKFYPESPRYNLESNHSRSSSSSSSSPSWFKSRKSKRNN